MLLADVALRLLMLAHVSDLTAALRIGCRLSALFARLMPRYGLAWSRPATWTAFSQSLRRDGKLSVSLTALRLSFRRVAAVPISPTETNARIF